MRIQGAVLKPNLVFYNPRIKFKDYITTGGGLMYNADLNNTFVTYSNGTSIKTRVFFGVYKKYPKILPGCTLTVPYQRDKNSKDKLSLTERLAIYSIISTSVSSLALILTQIL